MYTTEEEEEGGFPEIFGGDGGDEVVGLLVAGALVVGVVETVVGGAVVDGDVAEGATTITCIIPLSSCNRIWQWKTNLPTIFGLVNGTMILTCPGVLPDCGSTLTVSWYPLNGTDT